MQINLSIVRDVQDNPFGYTSPQKFEDDCAKKVLNLVQVGNIKMEAPTQDPSNFLQDLNGS